MPDFYHLVFVVGGWLLHKSHIFQIRLLILPYKDYDEYISASQQLDQPAKGLSLKYG